jgi:hypothetical protein
MMAPTPTSGVSGNSRFIEQEFYRTATSVELFRGTAVLHSASLPFGKRSSGRDDNLSIRAVWLNVVGSFTYGA